MIGLTSQAFGFKIAVLPNMLTGRSYRMRTATLAVDMVDGKRVAIPVPSGEIVKVISGPGKGDRLVDVLWGGRAIAMFSIDLKERCDEVTAQAAPA